MIQINATGPAACHTGGMTHDTEHVAGAIASVTGHYLLLDIFGSPAGVSTHIRRGEEVPYASHGQRWQLERETGAMENTRKPADADQRLSLWR